MNNSVFVRSQENRQKKPPKEELRLLLRAERKNSPDFRGNFVKSLKKNYDSLMLERHAKDMGRNGHYGQDGMDRVFPSAKQQPYKFPRFRATIAQNLLFCERFSKNRCASY